MTWIDLLTSVAGFLLTYLVHSTLILVPAWWLVAKRRWPADPGLRSQLFKFSLLAPLFTTLALTACGGPHWGMRIPLAGQGVLPLPVETVATGIAPADVVVSAASSQSQRSTVSALVADKRAGETVSTSSSHPEAIAPELSRHETADPNASLPSSGGWIVCLSSLAMLWTAGVVVGLFRLCLQWSQLRRLYQASTVIDDQALLSETDRLRSRLVIRRRVALRIHPQAQGPLAAGIRRPFILLPRQPIADGETSATLAHELAHIANRDAVWNLLLQITCRVFFFQPLNWIASHSIRKEMDFKADLLAVQVLGEPMSMVKCLYSAGRQLNHSPTTLSPTYALVSGMAVFQSTLGQRIEAILQSEVDVQRPRWLTRATMFSALLSCVLAVALLAPRAVNPNSLTDSLPTDKNPMTKRTMASMLLFAGLSMPATAEEPQPPATSQTTDKATLKTTPDELPAGIRRFNGMLVGRLAAKDVEQGTFTILVDAVPRVWRNSQAENPRSIVGKTINVSGVFGKFLDVLVVARIGETIEFECKHDGDGLVFPGELLRKVAPYDPADYPVLPEAFRGFRGRVAAEILKKDPETFELILRVEQVTKIWDGSSAKEAKSIEGKSLMLAGFWNRRDAYHDMKVGDRIDVGMQHIGLRSDHLTVAEEIHRTAMRDERMNERMNEREDQPREGGERTAQDDPLQGFKGMLVGRLLEKDAERGTFTITVDAVPRVWENNRSAKPKALIGKKVTAEGVEGRLIDALVVTKVGDTLEFGALHDGGPRIRVGEVLHKVAPVQPGDYPVLPDRFRGFRGMVTAKVIRKGDELSELIIEVEKIDRTFDGSQAENPKSIIGKQAILAGFWNRKDDFHRINVGDRIRCGMNHTQILSDHLVVIESVRKVDGEDQ